LFAKQCPQSLTSPSTCRYIIQNYSNATWQLAANVHYIIMSNWRH